MRQKMPKAKAMPKGRTAARPRKAVKPNGETAPGQAALAVVMALLHADRWVFEAGELSKKAAMDGDDQEFHEIRALIVKSLNRLQPLAYGAMEARGLLSVAQH